MSHQPRHPPSIATFDRVTARKHGRRPDLEPVTPDVQLEVATELNVSFTLTLYQLLLASLAWKTEALSTQPAGSVKAVPHPELCQACAEPVT
jgi:hypothetical protein